MAISGVDSLRARLEDGPLEDAIIKGRALLEEATSLAERVAISEELAGAHFEVGDVIESLRLSRLARDLAKEPDLRSFRFRSTLSLFSRESQFQAVEQGLGSLAEVRQLASEEGNSMAIGGLHLAVARLEAIRGMYASARKHLEVARVLLSRPPLVGAAVCLVDSALESHAGNLRRAQRAAEAGIAEAESTRRTALLAANLTNYGGVLVLSGRKQDSLALLNRALALSPQHSFIRFCIFDALAVAALGGGDTTESEEHLLECERVLRNQRVPALSHYNFTYQATRCALHEKKDEWEEIVRMANDVEPELARRQYRALSTTMLAAQARALAALGQSRDASAALARAVSVCPRGAVDPLIVIEATRAVCDVLAGRDASGRAHFAKALAGCRAIGHRYHEQWITSLRDRFRGRTAMAVPQALPPTHHSVAQGVLADVATILGAGHSVDLMGHRLAALFHQTPLGRHVSVNATGGHEYQALPSLTVDHDSPTRAISLRSSDRQFTIRVPGIETIDDIVLFQNVADIARVAVAHTADTEHEGDSPTLWPTGVLAEAENTIFRSPRMVEIMRVAARLADTELPILVTGETGTGKDIVARFIHAHSRNRRGPFLPFNGAAIPRDLVESQLFGHRKGAFTGAHEATTGVIRAAEGGTLFLDEIGELDLAVQPKLLRFLEVSEVHPVGEPRPQVVRVRLVAATNSNLDRESREGRFRRDLFFRLDGASIHLPPLRERKDEIPAMAELFLKRASKECGRAGLRLSDDFVAALLLYDWPGNIRELVNEIRRAVALAEDGATLTARDLGPAVARHWHDRPVTVPAPAAAGLFVALDQPLADAVQLVEDRFIARALERSEGRVSDAAKLLGVSRKGLFLKRRRQASAALTPDVKVREA